MPHIRQQCFQVEMLLFFWEKEAGLRLLTEFGLKNLEIKTKINNHDPNAIENTKVRNRKAEIE